VARYGNHAIGLSSPEQRNVNNAREFAFHARSTIVVGGRMRDWFQYFPGNFMWSQGMMIVLEMARWGGASVSEVDRVGQKLVDKPGNNDAWADEWEALARRIEKMAELASANQNYLTAGSHYLRAAVYYFSADRFLHPGSRKRELYESCLRCYGYAMRWRFPNVERVEVRYGDVTLPAWFMRAPGNDPAPAVAFFDGLDSSKELSLLFGGVELANRGIHTLAIDGPGQGEALRLRSIPSRFDYEVPAGCAYDWLAARPEVDDSRIAVMAFSMGGYYAPRAAAMDTRFAACVAWGGHFDYHGLWVERRKVMEAGGTKVSAPHFQLPWVLGTPDMDSAMQKLEKYRLKGVVEKMRCPFLVTHGDRDTITPVENAHLLYEAVGSADKTIRIFTAEEGGAEHCQGDNRQLGSNYVADWLTSRLKATPPGPGYLPR